MDCQAFEQQMEAYLAGDLTPVERTEMEKHQIACIHCQKSVDRATRLNDLLRDGLTAAAAMTPREQVALRQDILSQVGRARPSFWRRWIPHLAGAAFALAVVIVVGLVLLGQKGVPTVSAAEIIAHAQTAMDEQAGLSGVLHWEMSIETWGLWPDKMIYYYETEIWFDFDDPGRYHLHHECRGPAGDVQFSGRMVRDGIDHMWTYDYAPYRGGETEPSVDEIILSPEEMRELASWHIPSPFRDDLTRFADILPDVEVVGETTVVDRRAYLLQGQLFGLGVSGPDGIPHPVTSTVTLTIDAETYWLLGREEVVEGEFRPRITYRTRRFELLPQDQVPGEVFTFTQPEGVEVRQLEGIDSVYHEPRQPTMTLEETADFAPFVFLVPTTLPDDLKPLSHVLLQEERQGESWDDTFMLIYQGRPGRQIVLSESMLPRGPAWAARLVDIGGRQGWLENDLIDSQQFSLYLPNWDVLEHYTKTRYSIPEEPEERLPPGSIVLRVRGSSVDEAIAILESLEPYVP